MINEKTSAHAGAFPLIALDSLVASLGKEQDEQPKASAHCNKKPQLGEFSNSF